MMQLDIPVPESQGEIVSFELIFESFLHQWLLVLLL